MTETEFKPCPFCGNDEIIDDEDDGITCPKCGAYIDRLSVEDDRLLSDVWNKRPIESKMKRDNIKLMMTNKLLKKRVEMLEAALEVIMERTNDLGSKNVAAMALGEEE